VSHNDTGNSAPNICGVIGKVWMQVAHDWHHITRSSRVHITFQYKGVWPVNFTKGERKSVIELFRWLGQSQLWPHT